MFCLCPDIAWVGQNDSLQHLLNPYFAWCQRELPYATRMFQENLDSFIEKQKKICKPVASILTLKHIPVAYDESA